MTFSPSDSLRVDRVTQNDVNAFLSRCLSSRWPCGRWLGDSLSRDDRHGERFASDCRLFISSESGNGYNQDAGHASGGSQYSYIIRPFEQHRRIGFNVSQRCDAH
jgi:hypothetical protein